MLTGIRTNFPLYLLRGEANGRKRRADLNAHHADSPRMHTPGGTCRIRLFGRSDGLRTPVPKRHIFFGLCGSLAFSDYTAPRGEKAARCRKGKAASDVPRIWKENLPSAVADGRKHAHRKKEQERAEHDGDYILSGAAMPMRPSAVAMTCFVARVSSRRAARTPRSSSRMRFS